MLQAQALASYFDVPLGKLTQETVFNMLVKGEIFQKPTYLNLMEYIWWTGQRDRQTWKGLLPCSSPCVSEFTGKEGSALGEDMVSLLHMICLSPIGLITLVDANTLCCHGQKV